MPKAEIFASTTQRQHDETNCPIFAMLDLAYFSKNPSIMGYVQDNSMKSNLGKMAVHYVDSLPPPMMKATQSLTTLAAYHKTAKAKEADMSTGPDSARGSARGDARAALEETVKGYTVEVLSARGVKENHNVLALKTFFRCSGILVAEAMARK